MRIKPRTCENTLSFVARDTRALEAITTTNRGIRFSVFYSISGWCVTSDNLYLLKGIHLYRFIFEDLNKTACNLHARVVTRQRYQRRYEQKPHY